MEERTRKHAEALKEIQRHVGHLVRVVVPHAATNAGAAGEKIIKTHFMEDPGLEGVPGEQRNLMMKSV